VTARLRSSDDSTTDALDGYLAITPLLGGTASVARALTLDDAPRFARTRPADRRQQGQVESSLMNLPTGPVEHRSRGGLAASRGAGSAPSSPVAASRAPARRRRRRSTSSDRRATTRSRSCRTTRPRCPSSPRRPRRERPRRRRAASRARLPGDAPTAARRAPDDRRRRRRRRHTGARCEGRSLAHEPAARYFGRVYRSQGERVSRRHA
jgi:hypothetical protein